uniref:ATP synthase subunit 8 n=3 Tax=Micrabaciidae TaxID=703474 RepID=A0A7T7BWI3_9CNID|nr:ATP synthase subunit 8 [Letepsammia franki]QQK55203.1 ATP synthase subunit 8 [Rhombopsammia niphada]QQK55216.1 ATP synthase subunit 8 [Letepsammia superstes]
MPQLDITMYLTQYRWTLFVLFLLFFLLVFFVLPTIKKNWLIRKFVVRSMVDAGGLVKKVKILKWWIPLNNKGSS